MLFIKILGSFLYLAIAPLIHAYGQGSEVVRSVERTLKNDPHKIYQAYKKSLVDRWAFSGVLISINDLRDSRGRNLAHILAKLSTSDLRDFDYDLVQYNPDLLLIPDQKGVSAICWIAKRWAIYSSVVKLGSCAEKVWKKDFVEKITNMRFGPSLTFGDLLVLNINELHQDGYVQTCKENLKKHPILEKHPELLKLSIGEDRLGEVSISEYLKDRLTDTPFGSGFIQSIATSPYSFLFAQDPDSFLFKVLDAIYARYCSHLSKRDHGSNEDFQRTNAFLHKNWKKNGYSAGVKSEAVQAWAQLVNGYEDFGGFFTRELFVDDLLDKIFDGLSSETSLPMKVLFIGSTINIRQSILQDSMESIVSTGGVFGINFRRQPNKTEHQIYRYTFRKIADSEIRRCQESFSDNPMNMNQLYEQLKSKLYDVEYGFGLSAADEESFLAHRQNVYIGTAVEAAIKRKHFSSRFYSYKVLEDEFFDEIGRPIGLSGTVVKNRCQWMESNWWE